LVWQASRGRQFKGDTLKTEKGQWVYVKISDRKATLRGGKFKSKKNRVM